jgi:crotonobetainyl-CoA:carnitine CoA-transferase CaiB-like acyl-CoA transferase
MALNAPLEGVRVLDLTRALAGPYCTMLLGDFGADVIKVEEPSRGDESRDWGPPFVADQSAYFLSVNRNKRSVALDLRSVAGRAAARDLAAASDVLVENFRPGTAARLGLGYDELKSRNPALVYCSISGYGQDQPPLAGYDQIVQGTAGLMSITGMPDGPPLKFAVPICDIGAGMFGAHAVLAALWQRERTRQGTYIDVAMQDSAIALLTFIAGRYFATGEAPGREGNDHPIITPYGTFETADGYVNISVGNDQQWQRFCTAMEAPELAADRRFATNRERRASRDELRKELDALLRRFPTSECLRRLADAGIPAGAIRTLDEVFADPAVAARDMKVELQHPSAGPVFVTGAPWKLDAASAPIRRPPPRLGEHTEEVLRELAGYSPAQLESLLPREVASRPEAS